MTLSQSPFVARRNENPLHSHRFGVRLVLRMLNRVMREYFYLFLLRSGLSAIAPAQIWVSEQLAVLEASRAYRRVPAYRSFVNHALGVRGITKDLRFSDLPETSKDTYIKPAIITRPHDLFVDGTIPSHSAWDTSTGTSGRPTSWYRGPREVNGSYRLLLHRSRVMIGEVPFIFINGFALGQWATGMTAARAVGHAPLAIAHNVGANPSLILQLIQESWTLFPGRLVVVAGYPPHMEQVVQLAREMNIPLQNNPVMAVVGGEAMSEVQRSRITAQRDSNGTTFGFQEVFSFYGASDIDINIGIETAYTKALRSVLIESPSIARELFGTNVPFIPMIFAFDPLCHYIEVNEHGELVYTELSGDRISPRVRYNLGDKGMVRQFSEVESILRSAGINIPLPAGCRTPVVFVWGRVEDGVTFRGANLAWENLHEAIRRLKLIEHVQAFGIAQHEAEGRVLTDLLLHIPDPQVADAFTEDGPGFLKRIIDELWELNQDFRYQVQWVTDPADLPRLRLYLSDSPMAKHVRENPARKQKHVFLGKDAEETLFVDGGGHLIEMIGHTSNTIEVTPPATNLRDVWESILSVARHCPSPHNVQPWCLNIDQDGGAELYIDGGRTLPFADSTGSFVLSAMAMFLSYLEASAQNRGFMLTSQVEDVSEMDLTAHRPLFASLRLEYRPELGPSRFSDADLIRRKTSRKPSLKRSVSADVLRSIEDLVAGYGYEMKVVNEQAEISHILMADIKALFADIGDPRYFGELKPWLRLGDKRYCRDGLHYTVMNLPPPLYAFMKRFPQAVSVTGLAPILSQIYRAQLGHCEHIAIISGKFWKREDSLRAGRMLIDMWLTLSGHNIFIHPFGNLVTNLSARSEVESKTGVQGMWFVCRLGYTDEPEPSNRLAISEIATFVG